MKTVKVIFKDSTYNYVTNINVEALAKAGNSSTKAQLPTNAQ